MEHCTKCGKELLSDEIAIYKRLVNRGADKFWCISCLAKYMQVEISDIEEKIIHFKKMGCTLFKFKKRG